MGSSLFAAADPIVVAGPDQRNAMATPRRSNGGQTPSTFLLANLPEAHHVDVRQQVADLAGACPRNVGNVETILKLAHPTLIKALGNDTLRIYRAMQFCKLPRGEQLEQFIRYSEDRATRKAIRHCLAPPRKGDLSLDPGAVIEALRRHEAPRAGSVLVRIVRHKRTVILVGQDLLSEINSQKELPPK